MIIRTSVGERWRQMLELWTKYKKRVEKRNPAGCLCTLERETRLAGF